MGDDKKEAWRVTWGLDVVPEWPEHVEIFASPDVNAFRLTFTSQEEAALFRAELQRFLGDLLFRLSDSVQLPGVLRDMRALFGPNEGP